MADRQRQQNRLGNPPKFEVGQASTAEPSSTQKPPRPIPGSAGIETDDVHSVYSEDSLTRRMINDASTVKVDEWLIKKERSENPTKHLERTKAGGGSKEKEKSASEEYTQEYLNRNLDEPKASGVSREKRKSVREEYTQEYLDRNLDEPKASGVSRERRKSIREEYTQEYLDRNLDEPTLVQTPRRAQASTALSPSNPNPPGPTRKKSE
ncbi:hypothetical protein K505DRAFT_344557, partial [Melanomma pulvis-pyrius CBS 109.77]